MTTREWPGDRSGEPVIVAEGVQHLYPNGNGVHDVTLGVPPGVIFGLIGPSGSGKTTIVRLLLGLLKPDTGRLRVREQEPVRMDRRRIGYLPQLAALYPELTIRHNLDLVASLYGMPWRARWWPGRRGRDARERIDEVLALVGLTEHARTRLGDASGGEQRRLGLAAALVHEPDLLVLDEPTTGIDPVLRRDVWEHLVQLRDDGVTVVVTTQIVSEAQFCDRVGIVLDGELLVADTPQGLRERAYGGELLDLELEAELDEADLAGLLDRDGVKGLARRLGPRRLRLSVDDADVRTADVVEWARRSGHAVAAVAPHEPTFDEVFIALVEDERGRERATADDVSAGVASRAAAGARALVGRGGGTDDEGDA